MKCILGDEYLNMKVAIRNLAILARTKAVLLDIIITYISTS